MNRGTIVALLLACGVAQAAEWVSIAKAADGKEEFFVDVSSIRASDSIRRAWVKTVFSPHSMTTTTRKFYKKWWASDLSREAFDCAEETYRKEALTVHYDDGTVDVSPENAFPTPWIPVAPESVLDAEMKFICSWKQL